MGILTLEGGPRKVFTFRLPPESVDWQYTLRTAIKPTYGGRVIQILGAQIENVSITTMSGQGGEPYRRSVVLYFRDLMLWQRDNGLPVTLKLSGRNYSMKVYAKSINYSNSLTDLTKPISMTFAVQEDVNGIVTSKVISDALTRLQDGVGYVRSVYNDPDFQTAADSKTNAAALTSVPKVDDPNRNIPIGS